MKGPITPAAIDWQDGVPVSRQFGDVYFSRQDGLAETRHVFLQGNNLAERLAQLPARVCFQVGELGFGTGLNVLALWQLWQQVRPDNHSRLHVVTVEKHPLTRQDLARAHEVWPELSAVSRQLLSQYPPALPGPHRMIFAEERFSVDLWLGDADEILPEIIADRVMDAWFLDGFAPSCNPELWQQTILSQVMRLSAQGRTTYASFSVAGVVKQGLRAHGVTITRPPGYGLKRQMLKAHWPLGETGLSEAQTHPTECHVAPKTPQTRVIVGAGIAGLSLAWAWARRGYPVQLLDPLGAAGAASGNPRALLVPKLTALAQAHRHLHTLGWLSTLRWFADWPQVIESTGALWLNTPDCRLKPELLADYPEDVVQAMDAQTVSAQAGVTIPWSGYYFAKAGLLNPQQFAAEVTNLPLVTLSKQEIFAIRLATTSVESAHWQKADRDAAHWELLDESGQVIATTSQLSLCTALSTPALVPSGLTAKPLPALQAIRGQISRFPAPCPLRLPLSYGGYAACVEGDWMLGASFIRGDSDSTVREADHGHNARLLAQALGCSEHNDHPVLATLPPVSEWQGRASIRAQTRDYLPWAGTLTGDTEGMQASSVPLAPLFAPLLSVLTGLGSKGFAFAPLCAEMMVSAALGEALPVSHSLHHSLRVCR